jgi:hypothetical protein
MKTASAWWYETSHDGIYWRRLAQLDQHEAVNIRQQASLATQARLVSCDDGTTVRLWKDDRPADLAILMMNLAALGKGYGTTRARIPLEAKQLLVELAHRVSSKEWDQAREAGIQAMKLMKGIK